MNKSNRWINRVVLLIICTALAACTGMGARGTDMGSDKEAMTQQKMVEEKAAAGPMTTASDSEKIMMDKKTTGAMRVGILLGASGHHASGKVMVDSSRNGLPELQVTDFAVDRVPDGRIYLAKRGHHMDGVELGRLTQFSGTLTFPVPTGVNLEDYDSVVIWCKRFDVEIGHAAFGKPRMEGDHGTTK